MLHCSHKCAEDLRLGGRQPRLTPSFHFVFQMKADLKRPPFLVISAASLNLSMGEGVLSAPSVAQPSPLGTRLPLVTRARLTYQQEGVLKGTWIPDAAAVVPRIH